MILAILACWAIIGATVGLYAWERRARLREIEHDHVGRRYWLCPGLESCGPSGDGGHEYREPSNMHDGNLVSSLCKDDRHRPVIDLDVPCSFVRSSTPGHGHLYIDAPMSWERYEALLIALVEAGLVEEGYVKAACVRGQTFVRPPWVRKRK